MERARPYRSSWRPLRRFSSPLTPGLCTVTDLNEGLTPIDLVNRLLGPGIVVSNVTYRGASSAAGAFTDGFDAVGFGSGIVLSSGRARAAEGPNTADNETTVYERPGDADLEGQLPGSVTIDASVLEFEVVPASDRLTLQFMFASEEYNEFANTSFNDVFGLFIEGTNRALLPDGVTVVSIDNVNGGNPLGVDARNPDFYVNNDCSDGPCPIDMQADGKTIVLSVTANVDAGVVNRVKLAIADAGNGGLDSWYFLKEASLRATEVCDNGVDDDGDTLVDVDDPDCHRCGDEILDPGEDCDDGNLVGGDGCSTSCRFEACGNEVLDEGEDCDDGNTVSGDGCESNCTLPACGNEIVDEGEDCDDGNTVDGDCCSATCGFEVLGSPCDADHDFCTIDRCDGLAHCELVTLQRGCELGEGPFGDPTCSDGQDNDGDDLVDAQDPGCAAPVEGPPGAASCSDGLENDGDGLVDAARSGMRGVPPHRGVQRRRRRWRPSDRRWLLGRRRRRIGGLRGSGSGQRRRARWSGQLSGTAEPGPAGHGWRRHRRCLR